MTIHRPGPGLTGARRRSIWLQLRPRSSARPTAKSEVLSPEATGDAGQVYVSVTNAYGQGFAYVPFNYGLPPGVMSISPSSGPAAGGTTVYISGNNIDSATGVEFGLFAQYFYDLGGGLVEAVSPPNMSSTVDIIVVTLYGVSATTPADLFTFNPLPVVLSVSPAAGAIAGGTTVTISGQGLSGESQVDFIDGNGRDAQGTIQSVSDNTLVVIVPASPFANNPDTVDITVTQRPTACH